MHYMRTTLRLCGVNRPISMEYYCVTTESWTTEIPSSSREDLVFKVRLEEVYDAKADLRIRAFTCECEDYRIRGRNDANYKCKHIREAEKHYCGWTTGAIRTPVVSVPFTDKYGKDSVEHHCPICGRLAYPQKDEEE